MSTDHNCMSCERGDSVCTATKWCSECEEALCDECHDFHQRAKTLRHHHVVNISEVGNIPKIEVPKCTKHGNLDQDFFCITHDTLCCRQCMAETHRSCEKVLAVETASQDIKSSALVQNTVRDLEGIVEAFQSLSAKANEYSTDTEKQRYTVRKDIENKRSSLHKQVDEAADKLILQLDVNYNEVQQKIDEQKENFSKLSERFDNDKRSLQEAVEHGSACQVFILTQTLKNSLREGTQKVNESSLTADEITLDENKRESISMGEIGRTTKTWSANIVSSEQVIVENGTFVNKSLCYKNSLCFPDMCGEIVGIAVTRDGRIFLCDFLKNTVVSFSGSGKYKGSCKFDSQPFNICVIEDKKEAVCTLPWANKLGVIDTDELVMKRTVNLDITKPFGIEMTSSNIIIGTFREIVILSKEYESARIVRLDFSETTAVRFIHGAKDDRLYLSAKNFHAVTLNGKSLFNLDAKNGHEPNGICTDPAGNIYVAFSDSRISRLSKDGKVLNDNILDSNYGCLRDIAFNSDYTQMFVVTKDGSRVDVFDFK